MLELEKKNLKKKRDENVKVLMDLFGAKEYGNEYEEQIIKPDYQVIQPIGRSKNLNQKRLDEINSMVLIKYQFPPFITWIDSTAKVENNILTGDISIDVNGNIVGYGLSFEEKDIVAQHTNSNVNFLPFEDAINNYINNKSNSRSRSI